MKLYEANQSGLSAWFLAISVCVVIGSAAGADWANWRGPNYNGMSEKICPPNVSPGSRSGQTVKHR